ncbi:hypothetical protein Taro_000228 [Colocasia esculenta]|uniref:Uncharacterized protein n=1 Tax=Colocasia esculenta TaxID=4460 RepID=A0A843TG48_COLES|nr:hypothetical protein [Colocasia esculenta]
MNIDHARIFFQAEPVLYGSFFLPAREYFGHTRICTFKTHQRAAHSAAVPPLPNGGGGDGTEAGAGFIALIPNYECWLGAEWSWDLVLLLCLLLLCLLLRRLHLFNADERRIAELLPQCQRQTRRVDLVSDHHQEVLALSF